MLFLSHPKADFDLELALAIKANNDTLGSDGLVPSAMVYGDLPIIHQSSASSPPARPTTDERASLANIACEEMANCMARQRVQRALQHQTPAAIDGHYKSGEKVLI